MTGIEAILEELEEELELLKVKHNALSAEERKIEKKSNRMRQEIDATFWDYLNKEEFRKHDWLVYEAMGGINIDDLYNPSINLIVFADFRWLRAIVTKYGRSISRYWRLPYHKNLVVYYSISDKGDWMELRLVGPTTNLKERLTELGINIVGNKVAEELISDEERQEKFTEEIRTLCSKEN